MKLDAETIQMLVMLGLKVAVLVEKEYGKPASEITREEAIAFVKGIEIEDASELRKQGKGQ